MGTPRQLAPRRQGSFWYTPGGSSSGLLLPAAQGREQRGEVKVTGGPAFFPFPGPRDTFDLCLLLGKQEGDFLQITAQEFGIFKGMCRNKARIPTKDYFQLKYEGMCPVPLTRAESEVCSAPRGPHLGHMHRCTCKSSPRECPAVCLRESSFPSPMTQTVCWSYFIPHTRSN